MLPVQQSGKAQTSSRTSASLLRISSCRSWNVGTLQKNKKAFSHMRKQAHIVCCKSSGAENVENIKILNIVGEY